MTKPTDSEKSHYNSYARACNKCHTTFALGDSLIRDPRIKGGFAPIPVHLGMPQYLGETHPELWDGQKAPTDLSDAQFQQLTESMMTLDARKHAVTLGISCEACHLGAKQHAERKLKKPKFFPTSPHLHNLTNNPYMEFGRTHSNVNWACGRCHVGQRPQYAAGMATWNSTEYSDAMRGSCYTQLKCISCHNPHQTIGKQWQLTPEKDDQSCVSCHRQYASTEAVAKHTHHQPGTAGSRCMNCHMPRINEGMQDVVRTHMIFSPTNEKMLEANHPNACNLCHVDQPIDWTLDHLKQWYGKTYSQQNIAENYPLRDAPVAIGWLRSDFEPVRLVAADALTRQRAKWALPELLKALDDPYLLNRQFAQTGLERMLDVKLQDFGYRYYMTPQERRGPLRQIRQQFAPGK